uniref:Uncharacterized protein n=1 Tax=Oryza rufipogon TaxID=4529 RepID=A0A0E0R953_ORYRU
MVLVLAASGDAAPGGGDEATGGGPAQLRSGAATREALELDCGLVGTLRLGWRCGGGTRQLAEDSRLGHGCGDGEDVARGNCIRDWSNSRRHGDGLDRRFVFHGWVWAYQERREGTYQRNLISPEVDGGGSVRERATVVIVDAVHRRIVETLLHLRPVAQIRYSRGWHSEENKSRMLRCLTEISPSHIAGNAGRPAH